MSGPGDERRAWPDWFYTNEPMSGQLGRAYVPEQPYFGDVPVEITMYNDFMQPVGTMTKADWFMEVVDKDKNEMMRDYGIDNLDVIRALEEAGYWTEEDWEAWREAYDEVHG